MNGLEFATVWLIGFSTAITVYFAERTLWDSDGEEVRWTPLNKALLTIQLTIFVSYLVYAVAS